MTFRGAGSVLPFFGLALLTGCASAIGAPAGRALTPSLVPQEILVSALAQRSIAFQLSLVAGPAVGGILFAIRAELVYIVAIVLQIVALGCVLALRKGRVAVTEGAVGLDEVLAGVRLIRRTNVLFGAISLDLFAVLFGGAVALLPIFAKDILDVGPTGLGFLRTAPAIGSFVAALLIARFSIRRRAGPTLFVVVAGFGVCMIVFGLSREMWLSMARARARRRLRHGQRRSPLDDPPARDAGRAPRPGERGRDGLHQRVERARRVRVRTCCGTHRGRAGGCRSAASRRS